MLRLPSFNLIPRNLMLARPCMFLLDRIEPQEKRDYFCVFFQLGSRDAFAMLLDLERVPWPRCRLLSKQRSSHQL